MDIEGTSQSKFFAGRMHLEIQSMKQSITTFLNDNWATEIEPVVEDAIKDCLGKFKQTLQQDIEQMTRKVLDEMLQKAIKEALSEDWNLFYEVKDKIKKDAAKFLREELIKKH